MPYRVKVTRGAVSSSPTFLGDTGADERVDSRLYWGVKTAPVPVDSTTDVVFGIADAVLNANVGAGINPLVRAYTKFQGIEKLDTLVTGSGKDVFNDNKFTLARVALYNAATILADVTVQVTGTAGEHMLEAAYVRNSIPDSVTYTVGDGVRSGRITLASLVATSSALFNRFTGFAKFTNVFYGGFDGVNILDEDMFYFRDRSLSADAGGKNVETAATQNIGLKINPSGFGRRNNQVFSLREGISIATNPISTKINLLAVPGVRESYVTDHAAEVVKDYGLAMYVMDVPEYDKDAARLYDNSTGRSNVSNTIDQFESRVIDNNYVAVYFPDVTIDDDVNNRVVEVPPSVAALGALGFNDRTQQVWFAPAGFNRGALNFVNNVENRLSSADRDDLYDARINPIATFPRAGFVVFGQKTLQVAQNALDRINVRRMLIDVKRRIGGIAQRLVFEQNNAATRARFVAEAVQQLTAVQSGQGIEAFKVVCDETNNTAAEIEQNRMRGQIQVVPTRTVEFIAVDFIVTNSGVTFT
jgi:phage tail sheath protein FI